MDGKQASFGVFLLPVGVTFSEVRERAQAMDELGFHSLWLPDHMWMRGFPDRSYLEVWSTLCALAPATKRLRLGTLVLCNSFRNPALVAKMASTLDCVSGGRLELGLGAGWMEEEYRGYGYVFPSARMRIEQLDEGLEVIRRLFTQERADFQGKYYSLEQAVNDPKPVQKPHPPITVGGAGEKLLLRVVATHADRWNCPMNAAPEIERKIEALERHCRRVGREISQITISEQCLVVLGRDRRDFEAKWADAKQAWAGFADLNNLAVAGTPDRVAETLRGKVAAGVTLFALMFSDGAHPDTLRLFAEQVIPAVAST